MRDAMGWWRPCHVLTRQEEKEKAKPPDVDMEDLAGAQRPPGAQKRKKRAFVRKRSPLSQVYTEPSQ